MTPAARCRGRPGHAGARGVQGGAQGFRAPTPRRGRWGGGGQDLVGGQAEQGVERAADLEGAGDLEVLSLDQHPRASHVVQGQAFQQRRPEDQVRRLEAGNPSVSTTTILT
jgi:hypothetical protein